MQPQKYNELITNDMYGEAFGAFQQSTIYQRLTKKFTPLPYYLRFKLLRFVAFIASYCFNIFSAFTAATLVYFFIQKLTGNYIFAVLVTGAFILLLEVSKRLTAGRFFQNILQFKKFTFGLFLIGLLLHSLSIVFSFYGSQRAVQSFTPAPELIITDTLTNYHKEQIVIIENEIQEARNTRWKGTTTVDSQRTIKSLTNQKENLQAALLGIESQAIADNRKTEKEHDNKTKVNAYHFALFTLLLEALFLLCAWYLEYYDYRTYAEFAVATEIKPVATDVPPPSDQTEPKNKNVQQSQENEYNQFFEPMEADPINPERLNGVDSGTLSMAIKYARSVLNAWKAKKHKREGDPNNVNKHMEHWEGIINGLELQLKG